MPLQQDACLGKQDTITREWLCLGPRSALSASFKTMASVLVIFGCSWI